MSLAPLMKNTGKNGMKMGKALVAAIFFFALNTDVFAKEAALPCKWCVFGNAALAKDVVALAKLSPKQLLGEIRKRAVCVKVLDSRRAVPPNVFTWGQVEKATFPLADVSKISGLMGKTFCKGEQPVSKDCPVIALASDAPYSTLIHEYLHVLQSQRDPEWCPLSKQLWSRSTTNVDFEKIRDKEWDAHKLLWVNRDKMNFALEDKIAVATELIGEAAQRRRFDPEAENFIAKNKVDAQLSRYMNEYASQMKISRKGTAR